MIRLDRVSVTVQLPRAGRAAGARTLIHETSLELVERRVALIGANGSGKSTLLKLLNGLVLPTTGTVHVHGHDTVREGGRVRRLVGFVFTDPLAQLLMATPADDVELSLRERIRDRHARREAALGLLADRGLAHLADQSVYDLSGGERQLVALTSVLAGGPVVIAADEPTTLLDLRNRDRVRDALAALDQQVVLATHDLDMAAEADRVIVINEGRVAADGPAAQSVDAYLALMRR